VSSYYRVKKREADPPAREIRDVVLKEKVMEVWECTSAPLDANYRRARRPDDLGS
jgi:hypothetical protein